MRKSWWSLVHFHLSSLVAIAQSLGCVRPSWLFLLGPRLIPSISSSTLASEVALEKEKSIENYLWEGSVGHDWRG